MNGLIRTSLGRAWGFVRRAVVLVLQDLAAWGVVADDTPVKVLDHQGRTWIYRPSAGLGTRPTLGRASYEALLLDPDMVLRGELRVPSRESDLGQAAAWEVRIISPFPSDQSLWTWRERMFEDDPAWRSLELFIADRRVVTRLVHEYRRSLRPKYLPEVWAAPGVELAGFGEGRRLRRRNRRRVFLLVLAGTMLVAVMAAMVLPTWQSRVVFMQSQAMVQQLGQEAADAVQSRDKLIVGVERLRRLDVFLKEMPNPLVILNTLSLSFPDSAYVESYAQEGRVVRIRGLADDAALLMQTLREVPQFSGIRSTAAISEDARTKKERLRVEFELAGEDAG